MAAPKTKEGIHKDHVEKIAFLTARRNERPSVSELNQLLGTDHSDAYFSRRYAEALVDDGPLTCEYQCSLSEERSQQLEVELLHHDLDIHVAKFGVRALHVLPVDDHIMLEDETERWHRQVDDFGRMAARIALPYLKGSRTVGVNFGRQLASIARAIQNIPASDRKPNTQVRDPIEFVPCWGDALLPSQEVRWNSREISASGIANSLHEFVNGGRGDAPLSLHAVPVFRPQNFSPDRFATALELHAEISGYKKIFGQQRIEEARTGKLDLCERYQEGKVWNLDCILAGIGGTDLPGTIFSDAFYELAQIDPEQQRELLRLVCGDIAGVLLRKPGKAKRHNDVVSKLTDQWTCIDEDMLRTCASRGRESSSKTESVGVIAVAVGVSRAVPLIEAIKRLLVNVAIVDKACIDEMARLRVRLENATPAS